MSDMSESVPPEPMSETDIAQRRANIKRHSLWLAAVAFGFFASYIAYMIVFTSGL